MYMYVLHAGHECQKKILKYFSLCVSELNNDVCGM